MLVACGCRLCYHVVDPVQHTMAQPNIARETSTSRQTVKDSVADVGIVLDELGALSVFLVADVNAYLSSGAAQALHACLANRNVTLFTKFDPNPKLENVIEGVELFKVARPQVVLAVGGGTAIDMAKLINHLAAQPVDPKEALNPKGGVRPGRSLIAVPTTAGSGAEATHFAVVYIDGIKHSIEHAHIRPEFAVVDPSLTESVPASTAAHSGLDALCQAIESLWSVHADEVSIPHANEALGLILPNLTAAVGGGALQARTAMCRGAHLAGKAIDITHTTAAHALSYPLTSRFGVPHGAAVAMLIGPVLQFNNAVETKDCNDYRGPTTVRHRIEDIVQIFGCKSADEGASWLTGLVAAVDCPTRLSEVGVKTSDQIKSLVAEVSVDRLSNNPRKMTPETVAKLYADLI